VQAAIDAAQSAGGGVVYFPAGEYKFGPASGGRSDGNCLQITASNVVLRGEGKDKTTLYLEKYDLFFFLPP
jgi:polygalacturonase